MDSDGTKTIAEAAMEALREAGKVAPAERFERMVRWGLIDREGRVTRLAGGDAEPEPEARAAAREPAR